MKNLNLYFKTDGSGLWSNSAKKVLATTMIISYVNDEKNFGELQVYFDTGDWNVDQDGLIYTDKNWIEEFKTALELLGYDSSDISYSEQGMQGRNYVSLDIGKNFIDSLTNKD
jgi:hypothetical protein